MTSTSTPTPTSTPMLNALRGACIAMDNTVMEIQEKHPVPECAYSVKEMWVIDKLFPLNCCKCETTFIHSNHKDSNYKQLKDHVVSCNTCGNQTRFIVSEQCRLIKKEDADRLIATGKWCNLREEALHVVWTQDYDNKHTIYFDATGSDGYCVENNNKVPVI